MSETPTSTGSTTPSGAGSTGVPAVPASAAMAPAILVIEPDPIAPADRLGEWLFAEGGRLTTVRPWRGEAVPSVEELGASYDALVVLGGAMSAHDDAEFPWLEAVRALIRYAVAEQMPALAICLGAQVAAEALGGVSYVAGEDTVGSGEGAGRGEHGVMWLDLEPATAEDRTLSVVVDEAVRAAVRAGISTQDATRLPAYASHNDSVVSLPQGATLLASSGACPVHTWRMERLIAVQHHPEATPARMAQWAERDAAEAAGLAVPSAIDVARGVATMPDVPAQAVAAGKQARAAADEVDGVVLAFGRALARELVRHARGHASARSER